MRLSDTDMNTVSPRIEDEVRIQVEMYFRKYLPKGKLFQVAATRRSDYVEVMVFVANIKADTELYRKAKELANRFQDELSEHGMPTIIYVQTYTPPVRRI